MLNIDTKDPLLPHKVTDSGEKKGTSVKKIRTGLD